MADDNTPNLEDDSPVIFDRKTRRIDMFGKIDRNATMRLQSILCEFKNGKLSDKNKTITMVVNTCGGVAMQGLAIYDLCRSSGLNIRTIVLGEVASSGLAIALAGTERWMYENSIFHFHQAAMEFSAPTKVVERARLDMEQRQIKIVDELYAKITLENSKLSIGQLTRLERQEDYMTAPDALRWGLVHKIIKNIRTP